VERPLPCAGGQDVDEALAILARAKDVHLQVDAGFRRGNVRLPSTA
jgi:hypothetical protein